MDTGSTVAYTDFVHPNRKWYNNKRLIILNFWISLLLISSSANSYDGNIVYSFQALPRWLQYFNNPAGTGLTLLNSMQNFGSLAALPMTPYVADGLGRRTSIFIGALVLCVAIAIQTAANSLGMFIAARFLIGFGLAFSTTAAPLLITEIAYPGYRGPLTSAYSSFWYTGAIAAGWSTLGAANIQSTWSWRLPSILQLVPSVLQVALIWFGPESPRWLISKNRNTEALKTLAYYHADGNEHDPLVTFEYDNIKAAIDREVVAKLGLKTLFTTRRYGMRVKVVFILATFTAWNAYPLIPALITVGITNPSIQLLTSGALQIWNLSWSLFAASLVDRVGRRTLFLASLAGMIVFYSLQTVFSTVYVKTGNQGLAHAFVAFIFIFYSFFNLAFPTLLISYSLEIFPYSLRAKSIAFFNFFGYLMVIFGQHVQPPLGLGPFDWNIMYVVVLVGMSVFVFKVIIETKNLTLEETGTLFDGDAPKEPVVSATQNSTTHSSEEDEKPSQLDSQTFHNLKYIIN
jgi:MFS family permease